MSREAMQIALDALEANLGNWAEKTKAVEVLRQTLQTKTYIPTMDDAIAAGDGVLMNEQAALLRECRMALDHLLRDKPMLAAKVCGTTTLGNLRAMLHEYRPQGVFGGMK
jgi:hypothetical protein